ncbi:MAG: hypothetical protein RR549_06820 [Oscillospiraceae bacterium]
MVKNTIDKDIKKPKKMINSQKELLIFMIALNIFFEIGMYATYLVNNGEREPMGVLFEFRTIAIIVTTFLMNIMITKNIIYLKKRKALTKNIIIVLFIILFLTTIVSGCFIFYDVFIKQG